MADLKITQLDALGATPDDADILAIVDDVAGTPITKKITMANLLAGAGSDIFSKFIHFIGWNSIDGFTTVIDSGGSVEPNATYVYINTYTTNGYKAYIYSSAFFKKIYETGKKTSIEWQYVYLSDITSQVIYFHLTTSMAAPPVETADHIGFRITNADIYASNGDGTTQTVNDTTVDAVSGNQRTRMQVDFIQGTSAKFYVDGVLKNTHTTNLPDGDYGSPNVGITTNIDDNRSMQLNRILISKEY